MNTLLKYLYRDADNYKEWGSIVFGGEITDELRNRFVRALEGEEFFIADQIRVPELFPDTWPVYAADHCWHAFSDFELTAETQDDRFSRTIEEFVREVECAGADGWRDFDPQERSRRVLRYRNERSGREDDSVL
jgi:hypothetical protein